MALASGSFGLPPLASTPIVPFNNGLGQLNQFNNQPGINGQQFPWQQGQQSLWQVMQQNKQTIQQPFNLQQQPVNNKGTAEFPSQQSQQSLLQLVQQNKKTIQQPFNLQQQPGNNNETTLFPWQQLNPFNSNPEGQNTANGQNQTDLGTMWYNQWQTQNNSSKAYEDNSYGEDKEKAEEEMNEALEKMQENYQGWLKKKDKKRKILEEDFTIYFVLLLQYLMFDIPTANYFVACETLSTVLTKLGVNDEDNLVFLLFVQVVDMVALTRGRFKLVEGYQQNWYQEIYDYVLTKLQVNDAIRLGTQVLMPQSPAPEYEVR